MAEKKCKSCAMMIPKEAKICPHCRKRQGWGLLAKLFASLFLMVVITNVIASWNQGNSSRNSTTASSSKTTDEERNISGLGNNAEAESFAKAMTELAKATFPKGQIRWHLDLTPEAIRASDIVSYRKNVSFAKANVSVNRDEWLAMSETQQRNYINSCIHVLHKPPLISVSNVLDYYPNSSGQVSILVDGKVVATGKYSKTNIDIALHPNTYKPDEVGKYSATILVAIEGSGIQFHGTTNIPDSESILFTLKKGTYRGQAKAVVHNGTFSTDTFTDGGKALPFGKYSLQLNAINPMLEAEGSVDLPDTKSMTIMFSPTKL